jgi:hypothetical protein
MSSLSNITRSNSMFENFFYENWRRQKKNYETKIKSLNEMLKQMQEKLDGLQQKQLQGDLASKRNAINKSKFNKFDHINMKIVSRFCKNKMFPIYKFLEQSMLIFLLQQTKPVCRAYRTDPNTKRIDHSHRS